jgi:hypothetical protein
MKRFDPVYEMIDPIVKSYRKDMEYDRDIVNGEIDCEFILSARETGTHIISMYPATSDQWPALGERVPYLFATANRDEILDGVEGIAQHITANPGELLIHITRAGHKVIRPSEVLPIVQGYTKRVRAVWHAELMNNQ